MAKIKHFIGEHFELILSLFIMICFVVFFDEITGAMLAMFEFIAWLVFYMVLIVLIISIPFLLIPFIVDKINRSTINTTDRDK